MSLTRHFWPGPASASGDSLQTVFFSCRQISFGQGFIFLQGEREEGAKDVLIKYPALRVAEVSKQTLKLAWIDFSPLFTSSQKYLPFPGHVCFGFVSERRLCFCLGLALPGAPLVPPLRLGHHWPRQLGGREGRTRGRLAFVNFISWSFNARACALAHRRTPV